MEKDKKVRVYGYARESMNLDSGIEIQKEAITKFCQQHELDLIKIFVDNGKSAFKHRPNFEKLWSKLDEVDGIVVNDLTRFGRNASDLNFRLDWLNENKKGLILIREGIDSSKPEMQMLLRILSIFAQRERDVMLERFQAGLAYAKEHGTKSGKPCYRPPIEVNWKEYDRLRGLGLSISACAKLLGLGQACLYDKIRIRKAAETGSVK